MKKNLLLLAATMTAAGLSAVDDLGMSAEIFRPAEGGELRYRQAVIGADKPGKSALLLFLHGAGERGNDNISQLINHFPDIIRFCRRHEMKIVVLAPQCPQNEQWVDVPWSAKSHVLPETPSKAMKKVLALLDAKIPEFDVDRDRIYVTGISMGGYGSWDILSRRPDFFAGALILCGGADTACAVRLVHVPIRFFHGKNDTIVPVSRSRDMAQALHDAGSTCFDYRELDCGHFAWNIVYPDENNFVWLFSQTKKTPPAVPEAN